MRCFCFYYSKIATVVYYFVLAMNELLFECYSVPCVAYGIDALLSLYKNNPVDMPEMSPDAIVVSIGFHTIHIIPIIDGEILTEGVRRINIGFVLLPQCHTGEGQCSYN